ncbi:MAG: hypothetical protein HYY43_02595 [Deltaproteobacteria bacterium]|nr:hypothetical protein [Deltaproteobacteria bacterium]MBI2974462.1 hypothetical protein [Deltaproteobacteria bacterium]
MGIESILNSISIQTMAASEGRIEATAPGGTKAVASADDVKALAQKLHKLFKGDAGQQVLRSAARFAATAAVPKLASAINFGNALVELSKTFGVSFAADVAGAHLKKGINEQKKA